MSLLENYKSECIWAGRASSYPGQPKQSLARAERSPVGARSRYTLHWLNGPDRGTAVIYHQTVITVL